MNTEAPNNSEGGLSPEGRQNILVHSGTELLLRDLVEQTGLSKNEAIKAIEKYLKNAFDDSEAEDN